MTTRMHQVKARREAESRLISEGRMRSPPPSLLDDEFGADLTKRWERLNAIARLPFSERLAILFPPAKSAATPGAT